MKRLKFSPGFQKKLAAIHRRDKKLSLKIQKQLKIFLADPRHPSLRLHKLKGELKNVWSVSVDRGFRLLFIDDAEYYFFDLGEHDEIYQ
jgi:mRNA-degrading endonuclease YafQ of YafQ-DinJ toxin-antitoxin module